MNPIAKPHSVYIIPSLILGTTGTYMEEFSFCPYTTYRSGTLWCPLPQRFSRRIL
jgi:hypothetical protein